MTVENLISELEKLRSIYPESSIWIEGFDKEFTSSFDIKVLVTDSEEEVTLKMTR